jgi:histidinol dehydrogenase
MKIIEASQVQRRSFDLTEAISAVIPIIRDVKDNGDSALRKYALRFDGQKLESIAVSKERRENAHALVAPDLKQTLKIAQTNIAAYHRAQLPKEWWLDIAPGVRAGQLVRPLSKVGCYIPGGKYPLVSTVLMTAVAAKVAGVEEILVCTPRAVPEILVACDFAGVNQVFEVGGAQAIAAMAYGTESVPKVDKIVGPGNRYVTAAKKLVYGDVGIDFLAGPSEVLVIADETSEAAYIAADLLAQAEHDEDAVAILATPSLILAKSVIQEIERQLAILPTQSTARSAIECNGTIILTRTLEEAFEVSNRLAPEHLEIHLDDPNLLRYVKSAGAVFLGKYSAEAFGDYAVGPNHVLPTGGFAAAQSGLSVLDFLKTPTVQQLTLHGAKAMADAVITLAKIEGLEAHAEAINVRI